MIRSKMLAAAALAAVTVVGAGCAFQDTDGRASMRRGEGETQQALADRLYAAGVAYRALVSRAPDQAVPQDLLRNARCVAIIPGSMKAAFIVGGSHGRGAASCRLNDGTWSAPAFVGLTGGSVGWQVGAESTDLVIFLTSDDAKAMLAKPELRFGADIGVSAGPIGRQAGVSTGSTLEGAYAYGSSTGAFAGVAIDGARLYPDTEANDRYYIGESNNAFDILSRPPPPNRPASQEFTRALLAS